MKSDSFRCTLEFPPRLNDIKLTVTHVTAKNNRLAARYILSEFRQGIKQGDYITVWALDTGNILYTTERLSHIDRDRFGDVLGFLQMEENMLLSPLLGSGIGRWDLNTGACTILGVQMVTIPSFAIVKNKVIATQRGHSAQIIDLDGGTILTLWPGIVHIEETYYHSNVWFTGGNAVITQSNMSTKVWGIKPPKQEPPKPEASEIISQYVQQGITFLKHLWE